MTAFHDLITPRTPCHTTYSHTFVRVAKREIHVQTYTSRQPFGKHLFCNLFYNIRHRREIRVITVVAQRESHGWDIFHAPFERNAHSAGVMRVHGCVVAMIDAPDNHVGTPSAAKLAQSNFHAVDRCAVARPHLNIVPLSAQLQPIRKGVWAKPPPPSIWRHRSPR